MGFRYTRRLTIQRRTVSTINHCWRCAGNPQAGYLPCRFITCSSKRGGSLLCGSSFTACSQNSSSSCSVLLRIHMLVELFFIVDNYVACRAGVLFCKCIKVVSDVKISVIFKRNFAKDFTYESSLSITNNSRNWRREEWVYNSLAAIFYNLKINKEISKL